MNCISLENDGNYILKSEMMIECYNDEHYWYLNYVVYPNIVLWLIVYPALLFLTLLHYARSGRLETEECYIQFGFIFREYEPKVFYWEFVKMYMRVILLTISIFYEQNIALNEFLFQTILFVYTCVMIQKMPYNQRLFNKLNYIDLWTNVTLMITIFCSHLARLTLLGLFFYGALFTMLFTHIAFWAYTIPILCESQKFIYYRVKQGIGSIKKSIKSLTSIKNPSDLERLAHLGRKSREKGSKKEKTDTGDTFKIDDRAKPEDAQTMEAKQLAKKQRRAEKKKKQNQCNTTVATTAIPMAIIVLQFLLLMHFSLPAEVC